MLVGYVSNERYVALDDVHLEFEQDGKPVAVVRSTPRGAVYADLAPGRYRVTLVKDGYGPKSVEMTADPATPYQAGGDLARELRAPLITFDGTQHTTVFDGNSCVDDAVVRYFVDRVVPGNLFC